MSSVNGEFFKYLKSSICFCPRDNIQNAFWIVINFDHHNASDFYRPNSVYSAGNCKLKSHYSKNLLENEARQVGKELLQEKQYKKKILLRQADDANKNVILVLEKWKMIQTILFFIHKIQMITISLYC